MARPPAAAWDLLPAEYDTLIRQGMERSLRPDYDGARASFEQLVRTDPDHPVGYFFLAALYHTMIIDYEDFRFEPQFNEYAGQAKSRITRREEQGRAGVLDWFFSGTLDGYQGLLSIKRGDWWSGFRAGLKGLNAMERVLAADSTFYDAWWCVGVYQFYRSKMTRILWWLPFISDQREAGIGKLRTAMERGHYARVIAQQSLIWILYEEKRYDEALALARDLHRRYPGNRMFLWTMADIHYELKQWEEALTFYKKILEHCQAMPYDNHYNAIISRWKTARIHFFCARYPEAAAQCDTILGYELDRETAGRLKEKLPQARDLKKEAESKK